MEEQKEAQPTESKKLKPGSTLEHKEVDQFSTDEAEIEKSSIPNSWTNCDARSFQTRIGPDYKIHGLKASSKPAMYEIFAIDGFRSPKKVANMEQYFDLPELAPIKNSKLPPLLIVNFMVPNYGPPVFGDLNDGDGFSLVMFAKISDTVRELLEGGKTSPSTKLFEEFILGVPDNDDSEYRDCCKVILRTMNNESAKYGFVARRLVRSYNSTPFLARTSTTFYHNPGVSFSIDIDAHVFGKPARKGLNSMINYLGSVVYDWGLVIEARKNEHLPEQVLCCGRVSKTGIEKAGKWPF